MKFFRKLGVRIYAAILLIVFVLVIVTLLLIRTAVRAEVEDNIVLNLSRTKTAFEELRDAKREQLLSKVEFFLTRKSFRREYKKARSLAKNKLLEKYQEITGLEYGFIVRLDGKIAESLNSSQKRGQQVSDRFTPILLATVQNGRYLGTWLDKRKIIQGVALPVNFNGELDSVFIGGSAIDKQLAFKLDEITRNQLSIFIGNKLTATALFSEFQADMEKAGPALREVAFFEEGDEPDEAPNDDASKAKGKGQTKGKAKKPKKATPPPSDDQEAQEALVASLESKKVRLTLNGEEYVALVEPFFEADGESDEEADPANAQGAKGKKRKKPFYVIATSLDKQLAIVNKIEIFIILTGIAGIFLAGVLGLLFSRALTRSVNALVQDVREVKDGDLDHEVVKKSEDEIGYIAENFDAMRLAFRQSQQQLKDYADNLENKVAERTAELTESNKALNRAKQETDQIMQTVDQGLFLLYNEEGNYKIGNQYSTVLRDILEDHEPESKPLSNVVKDLVPQKTIKSINDYFELMFKNEIAENVLTNLNPLREIETKVRNPVKGQPGSKHLKFKFTRIKDGNIVNHLMATVSDVTRAVHLTRQLKETEEKNRNQMELVFSILHVEPKLLLEFIRDVNEELDSVNQVLRPDSEVSRNMTLRQKLESIYRSIHTVKGNSSLLNLNFFAEKAHVYEDKIGELLEKEDLSGGDFLPLVLKLNEMRDSLKELNQMLGRLTEFQKSMAANEKSEADSDFILTNMVKTVEKLNEELGKKASLAAGDFSSERVPETYRKFTKDVLIQMLRNSMSHGIETPTERTATGKPEQGTITIKNEVAGGRFVLEFKDDGRGLQVDKLKAKALQSGKWTKDEVEAWDDSKTAQIIFQSGMSTAESTSMTAGRGVGMDIIKQKVTDFGGKIQLGFKKGKYLSIRIELPI